VHTLLTFLTVIVIVIRGATDVSLPGSSAQCRGQRRHAKNSTQHTLDILSIPWRILTAGALIACPVFFSGLIFSQSFKSCSEPAQFLGMNLLGAVIGGALENLVMIGGLTILGVSAIVLYALAAASYILYSSSTTITDLNAGVQF